MANPAVASIIDVSTTIMGFIENYIFEHKGFQDVLSLILLGIIFRPLTSLVDASSIMSLAPYFASLALVSILFDAGMVMKIYRALQKAQKLQS